VERAEAGVADGEDSVEPAEKRFGQEQQKQQVQLTRIDGPDSRRHRDHGPWNAPKWKMILRSLTMLMLQTDLVPRRP
jgi:hypothetical protein